MVYPEHIIKRVAEIGILACEQGRLADAETIFAGVTAIAEDAGGRSTANLGMAATKIASGEFEEGIQLLSEELAAADYENLEALALLVYALRRTGRHKEADTLVPKLKANPSFQGSMAEEVLAAVEV